MFQRFWTHTGDPYHRFTTLQHPLLGNVVRRELRAVTSPHIGENVLMGIDKTWQERPAVEVDDLGLRALERHDRFVTTDCEYVFSKSRQGLRLGESSFHRHHVTIEEDDVRRHSPGSSVSP